MSTIDLSPLKDAKLPILFIIGCPGSGKGTQCNKIVKKYGLTHLSSGDLLREKIQTSTELGEKCKKIMEKGDLVPSKIVLELIKVAILEGIKNGSKGFLIDGYPRDEFESEIQPATLVIYFEARNETLIKRLLERGRSDDKIDTIKNRLKTFFDVTCPVIDYYSDKEKLVKISAENSVDEIFENVCVYLDKHLSIIE